MSFLRLAPRLVQRASVSSTRIAVPRMVLAQKQPLLRAAYSSAGGLTKPVITSRIFEVLRGFEGIDPTKLTETASFDADLGLDSLDTVEVVMAVEEEFGIEIPDSEADEIRNIHQAIEYIAKTPDAS